MAPTKALLSLVCLLMPGAVWGQQLWASWELELDGHAPPTHFVLHVSSPTGTPVPPAMTVPWASCTTVPSAQHCAPIGCPPQGTYDFVVRAHYAEVVSAPSNTWRCTIVQAVCQCREISQTPPPPPLPPVVVLPPPSVPVLPPGLPPLLPVTAEGLNLRPVGELPPLPSMPAIPASAGV